MQSNPVATPETPAVLGSLPVLRAIGLGGQRGERPLFERLDLALEPGSVTWLRGRNGRGKTTLLRLLAGLASPTAGEIRLGGEAGGRTAREAGPAWRRMLVFIGHHNALKDDLDAGEALAFLCRLSGARPAPERIQAALARLGVQHKRRAPVRTLSQGQRRRVALARLALALDQPLWLLDEPFVALDGPAQQLVARFMEAHLVRGGMVLFTSHQPVDIGGRSRSYRLGA